MPLRIEIFRILRMPDLIAVEFDDSETALRPVFENKAS